MTIPAPATVARPGPARVREALVAGALLALVFLAYRFSPERDLLDAKYALLTSEALVTKRSWNLAPYFPALAASASAESTEERKMPWQLHAVDGRLAYLYPPGTPLLSAPFFAVLRLFGGSNLDRHGGYSMARERQLQALLASLFTTGAVLLGFRIARRELPPAPAATVALVAGFSTGYWSVASRTLWSHTWSAVLLSAALLELVRWEDGARRRPALLGAILAAAFWVRPTNSFSAAAFTLVVAWRYRALLPKLVAAGAAGGALYVLFAREVFDAWFPPYLGYVVPRGRHHPAAAFVGELFSAEHGLIIFTPVLLAVAWALARNRVAPERRVVAALALGLVAFYLVYHSWRAHWWGEGTVGPRYLCDVTPYLLWLSAHAWRRARERPSPGALGIWPPRLALALLVAAGVAAHATGTLHVRPGQVAGRPRNVRFETIARIGSAEYWRKLPQVSVGSWLAAHAAEEVGAAPPKPKRSGQRRRAPRHAEKQGADEWGEEE